jgi:hypothetical protein
MTTPNTAAKMPRPGSESAHSGESAEGYGLVVVMDFHIQFHHLVDIKRFNSAGCGHAHRVANKIQHMMILQEAETFAQVRLNHGVVQDAGERVQAACPSKFALAAIGLFR